MVPSSMVLGLFIFSILAAQSKADIWPGDGGFYTICQEILSDVVSDAIRFRQSFDYNQIREVLSKAQLCNRLVDQHNDHNMAYLGGAGVSYSECEDALDLNPLLLYGIDEWDNWSGRHCGSWRTIDDDGNVSPPHTDHALWNPAAVPLGSVFRRQSVTFLTRPGTCCDDGWNESGGSEVVVWGWDPKDPSDHGGYQGSHAGYPFTSGSGAECIVWLTGEEAFLECIKTVVSTKKRTSAGFWGFGQWNVQSINTQYCLAHASDLGPILFPGRLMPVPAEPENENNIP